MSSPMYKLERVTLCRFSMISINSHFVFSHVSELQRDKTLPSIREEILRKRVKCVQLLFQLLPLYNYHLLKPLLALLHKVAINKDTNRMDATCLAKLFAPVIMCPKTVSSNNEVSPVTLEYLRAALISYFQF